MNELVSVIIPTQNGKDIKKTIDSVFSQSYKNIEIIVVDDNGADSENQIKTKRILQELIDDGRVKYVVLAEHKNGSYARNVGFSQSSGVFIQYLDDDDLLFPSKIEDEVTYLEKNKCDMVACGAYFINSQRVGYIERPVIKGNLMLSYLMGEYMFNTSTWLVRREVVEALHGFDDRFYRHQDWEFCLRIMASFKVELLSTPLVIKTTDGRNKVNDPERSAELREFFLETRKQDMLRALGERKTRKVFEYHYKLLAIGFAKKHNIQRCMAYLRKCKNLLFSLIDMIFIMVKLYLRKKLKGNITVSKEELRNLM